MGLNVSTARLLVMALLGFLVLAACSGDVDTESLPSAVDPLDAAHILPPTDEMMELAREQCEDGRAQGVVELVRPGSDEVVSRAVVDCS